MTTIVSYDSFRKVDALRTESFEGARYDEDAELRAYFAVVLDHLEQAGNGPGMLCAPEDQLASLAQSYLAEHPDELAVTKVPAPAGGLEVRYDRGDLLGWFRSVFTWWRRICPESWLTAPQEAQRVGGGQLRVALLGDWGTGLYGAPVSARSIENDPEGYGLLVHLGDVYYSGTEKEVQENFLRHWPQVPGAISRAVNSNHEMYSGGVGLFRHTLPRFGQEATYFAVQTDDWLLVGLDTAYAKHDLHGGQVDWLDRLLADAGERRLILFTHHQPFSRLDRRQGPRLVGKLVDSCGIGAYSRGTGGTSTVASSTTVIRRGTCSAGVSATVASPRTVTT